MGLSIQKFASFLETNGVVGDRQIVASEDGNSVSLRNYKLVEDNATRAAQNKAIRQQFLNAVLEDFHATKFSDLPKGVRDAFKVGFFKDDMKIDGDKNVTSGRPLTARRIKAVLAAVRKNSNRVAAKNKYEQKKTDFVFGKHGCIGYALREGGVANCLAPFEEQVNSYHDHLSPATFRSFLQMLVDAASYLARPDARPLPEPEETDPEQSWQDALPKSNGKVNDVLDGINLQMTVRGIQSAITNGYGKWTESSRKEAVADIFDVANYAVRERVVVGRKKGVGRKQVIGYESEAISQLKNALRYGTSEGRPKDLSADQVNARLKETRATLEAAWSAANAELDTDHPSLEQKFANDLLRYVIDNWLDDEVEKMR